MAKEVMALSTDIDEQRRRSWPETIRVALWASFRVTGYRERCLPRGRVNHGTAHAEGLGAMD